MMKWSAPPKIEKDLANQMKPTKPECVGIGTRKARTSKQALEHCYRTPSTFDHAQSAGVLAQTGNWLPKIVSLSYSCTTALMRFFLRFCAHPLSIACIRPRAARPLLSSQFTLSQLQRCDCTRLSFQLAIAIATSIFMPIVAQSLLNQPIGPSKEDRAATAVSIGICKQSTSMIRVSTSIATAHAHAHMMGTLP